MKKSCQRCFQALRIDVNQEFEVLESFLTKLPGILAPGGRAAILTFHSGEDRLVKYYFKEGKKDGLYSDVANDVIRRPRRNVREIRGRDPRRCAGRSVRERIPIEINVIEDKSPAGTRLGGYALGKLSTAVLLNCYGSGSSCRWQALRMRFC